MMFKFTLFALISVFLESSYAQIDNTNVTNGNYFIFNGGFALTANDSGFQFDYLGNVTLEPLDRDAPEQLWSVQMTNYYAEQGPYQLRYIMTRGPNTYNHMNIELPAPGTFPVNHYWRLDGPSDKVLINSRLQFDWNNVGDNKCLQSNGENMAASFEDCDETNVRQQWDFVLEE